MRFSEFNINENNQGKYRDLVFLKPGQLKGSYSERELTQYGFKKASNGSWYISRKKFDELVSQGKLSEGLKTGLAAAGLAGAMALGGAAYDKVKGYFNKQPAQQTQQVAQPSTPKEVKPLTKNPLEKFLLDYAKQSGLTGVELAQFMAQCAHETRNFNNMVEYGGIKTFNNYDPKFNPRTAKLLGNKFQGDGIRFKGRGFIQLTGRYNYTDASKDLGIDLVSNPDLASDPEIAAKVAVWFWKDRVKPSVNDYSDIIAVTRKINKKLNGIGHRAVNFQKYMATYNGDQINHLKENNTERKINEFGKFPTIKRGHVKSGDIVRGILFDGRPYTGIVEEVWRRPSGKKELELAKVRLETVNGEKITYDAMILAHTADIDLLQQDIAEDKEEITSDLSSIIQSFVNSPLGQKYQKHDCKTVTRAFVQWTEQKKIPTRVISFAPPSEEFIKQNPQFKGKSGQGDGHIAPIVKDNVIDFTIRQFGINRTFDNPLITPVNNLKSIYGKFGYFTDKPKWFLGGKSYWIGSLSSIPSEIFNQNFGDELLESNSKKDPEEYKQYLIKTLPSIMRFLKNSVSGWTPSVEQMLDAIDIAYNVMKDTGDIKLAGKAFNDELNKLYKISQNNQDVSESSYKEGGSITHDGVKYDFDKVLAMAETKPTKQCPVSKLEWVLAYDEPDTTRLKNADISVPVVITKSNNGKLTVIDGLHRLAKAVDKNVNSLPVKYITNDELQSARLKQYVAEGSNQSYIFYRGEPILSSDRLKQLQASIGKPYPILRKEGSPSHIGTYMLPDRENAEGYVKQALAGKGKGGTVTKIEVDVNSFKNGDGGVDQAVIITNIAGLVSKQDPDPKDPLRINDRKKSMVYYLGPGVKKYLNDPYLNDPELVKKWYDPEFAKRMWDIIKSGKQAVTKPGENQIQERMIKILGPLAEKIRRDPEVINYFLRHSPNDWVERNFRMNSDGSGTKVIDVQYFPPVTKEGVAEDQSNDDLEIINKVESSFHNGYHGVLIAKTPERQVGYLSYSIYNDVPKIEMIYVAQDYRRHGVAKKMLKALQEISPNEEIDWGYTTDDGTNLKKSIDFIKKPNPEIIKKKAKLAGIQSKLARLNIKLEKLMDTNPELARRYVQTVGDRWNKLNDIEHRLKDELYSSKGEYSKFIPETEK